jgi:hypothetical protein
MPPEKVPSFLLADVVEVDALQQGVDRFLPRATLGDPLQDREVVEHRLRRDFRVNAELLREVAEEVADVVLLAEDVELAEARRAGVRLLQRGQRAHERRLAGAVRSEQAEHAGGDGEGDAVERADAVRIGLGQTVDLQFEHGRMIREVETRVAARPRIRRAATINVRMSRVIVAEYDANENAFRLAEPLPGVKDHQKVRISIEKDEASHRSVEISDPLAHLAALDAPVGDIQQMLSEIEAGRR